MEEEVGDTFHLAGIERGPVDEIDVRQNHRNCSTMLGLVEILRLHRQLGFLHVAESCWHIEDVAAAGSRRLDLRRGEEQNFSESEKVVAQYIQ